MFDSSVLIWEYRGNQQVVFIHYIFIFILKDILRTMSQLVRLKKTTTPSKIPPEKFFLDKCRVCGKQLSLFSQRQSTNVFKTTTCCKVYGCLHISCARKVSTALDGSYQFDPLTYESDTSTSLYCFLCMTKFFYCKKQHDMPRNNKEGYFKHIKK